jgi:predicted small secreted protein
MKKLVVVALIALTAVVLVGCGSTAKGTGSSDSYYHSPSSSK